MIHRQAQHGFSLIELLLAIFILGIGIVSIATLFPAGIAQQQKTADDVIGPIVARNALTLLRSRVEQDDFGGAEVFDPDWSPLLCGTGASVGNNPWPTVCGDWMWRRPAIVPADYGASNETLSLSVRGAIDIFSSQDTSVIEGYGPPLIENWTLLPGLPGIPYNKGKHPDKRDFNDDGQPISDYYMVVPEIRIMAAERQYPMWSGIPEDRPKAQYYWDCMFRRYKGNILVAIFVYRVIDPSQDSSYTVDTNGLMTPNFPYRVNLATEQSTGSWDATTEELTNSQLDDPALPQGQWQYPGQWIVDQNGNVHRVQRGRRRASDSSPVLLTARPSELPVFPDWLNGIPNGNAGSNVHWWDKTNSQSLASGFIQAGVVTDIWFVPTSDSQGRKIIPVYAMVVEL